MKRFDTRKRVFDLQFGDRFMYRGREVEVVSPYEVAGIIFGLTGFILPTKFKDTTVYCVDTHFRQDIYPINTNYLVYAY